MRVLIAPDSFKGSLTALNVANTMKSGFLQVFPHAEADIIPMADGGEGTVSALVEATGGMIQFFKVMGPNGKEVEAHWGLLGGGKGAVIEMASASGLPLLSESERNPMQTTTYGTGQLIKRALDVMDEMGLAEKNIVIGIGGSATNDGGSGAIAALGAKFLDKNGQPLPFGGAALANLDSIDLGGLDSRLKETKILVACDVDNPLCGERGASAVFGPQKGATPEMVQQLDAALWHYADVCEKTVNKAVRHMEGAGAAGGLGAGLLLFTNSHLQPGVELVLDITGFAERVATVDIVLTGEGQTDFQTAFGKAPVGVAKMAAQYGKPVICISGSLGKKAEDVYQHNIDALASSVCACVSLKECMENAAPMLEAAVARVAKTLAVGMKLCAS